MCVPFPSPTVSACTAADGGLATDLLSLYPASPSLEVNCSAQFSVLLGTGTQQCNFTSRVQQWASSNPLVATIDATGNTLALSAGTTTITATEFMGTSSVQTSTTLTVVASPTPTPTPTSTPTPTPTPAPPVTLSQPDIDFGYQLVGTTSPQTTETVINSGIAPLVIKDISVSGRDRSDFTPSYNFALPLTIAPGDNVSIKLTFTPALPWRAGKRNARLEIDQKKSSSYVSLDGIGATCGGPLPGCSSGCADAEVIGQTNPIQRLRGGKTKMFRRTVTAALLSMSVFGAAVVLAQKISKELDDAISAASNFADWKPADSMYPKEDGKLALENGKTCIEKIDEATSKGLAGSTEVDTNKGKMTITEAREMCVKVRDAGQKVFGDLTAEEEAQYEPFRKILSGDKLNLYNDRLKKYKLYGAGGKVLKTPADYRDSPLWCTTGVDREGILPVWSVDCWHFKGMARVGSVESRTGTGDQAPSSAFH